jgi:hypothetical protein
MHIKRNVDELMAKSNVPVRSTSCLSLVCVLTLYRRFTPPVAYLTSSESERLIQVLPQSWRLQLFFRLVLWPLS